MIEYFVYEPEFAIEEQKRRNDFTLYRIGKISPFLQLKHPSDIIPFKGTFPFVTSEEYHLFIEETLKQKLFVNLPERIKDIVRKAEKVVSFHNSFSDYLNQKRIGAYGFKMLEESKKAEIFYMWLFENKLDIDLVINNY